MGRIDVTYTPDAKSVAHKHDMNHFGIRQWPDGLVPWTAEQPPILTGDIHEVSIGRLRGCAYCGSMHPTDAANAIRNGAIVEWADRKYSWPHKIYLTNVPNPFAGQLESRASANYEDSKYPRKVHSFYNTNTGEPEYTYKEEGRPASATTDGKFYSVHLQDATPDDRDVIEKAMGLKFEFMDDGQSVRWRGYNAGVIDSDKDRQDDSHKE